MYSRFLDDRLKGWGTARRNVISEVKNIPAHRFDFKPHAGSRTVAEICRHIAQSTLVFAREITREDASLARQPLPAIYREHAGHLPTPDDQDGLIALLESSWTEAEQTLRKAGPEILGQEMLGLAGQPVLRFNALVFAECHEFYHAGQLTVYERSLDVVPALTRLFASMGFTGVQA
jgi:uncharacterized damage-inducible protein DinB